MPPEGDGCGCGGEQCGIRRPGAGLGCAHAGGSSWYGLRWRGRQSWWRRPINWIAFLCPITHFDLSPVSALSFFFRPMGYLDSCSALTSNDRRPIRVAFTSSMLRQFRLRRSRFRLTSTGIDPSSGETLRRGLWEPRPHQWILMVSIRTAPGQARNRARCDHFEAEHELKSTSRMVVVTGGGVSSNLDLPARGSGVCSETGPQIIRSWDGRNRTMRGTGWPLRPAHLSGRAQAGSLEWA